LSSRYSRCDIGCGLRRAYGEVCRRCWRSPAASFSAEHIGAAWLIRGDGAAGAIAGFSSTTSERFGQRLAPSNRKCLLPGAIRRPRTKSTATLNRSITRFSDLFSDSQTLPPNAAGRRAARRACCISSHATPPGLRLPTWPRKGGGRARSIHSGETLFVRGADCSVRAPAHMLARAVTGVYAQSQVQSRVRGNRSD
jgi:hypothetical protein